MNREQSNSGQDSELKLQDFEEEKLEEMLEIVDEAVEEEHKHEIHLLDPQDA